MRSPVASRSSATSASGWWSTSRTGTPDGTPVSVRMIAQPGLTYRSAARRPARPTARVRVTSRKVASRSDAIAGTSRSSGSLAITAPTPRATRPNGPCRHRHHRQLARGQALGRAPVERMAPRAQSGGQARASERGGSPLDCSPLLPGWSRIGVSRPVLSAGRAPVLASVLAPMTAGWHCKTVRMCAATRRREGGSDGPDRRRHRRRIRRPRER